jgi:lysophospholipase L1-like esterase/Flp pilus assembly protein TadD
VTPQEEGRRRGGPRGPLLALIVLGLALGVVEGALRLTERAPTPEEAAAAAVHMRVPDGKLTVWDPDLYYRLRPGMLLAGHYPINALGTRGPVLSPAGADRPDALRIVCVGDSSTFGLAVGEDETWPAWLQQILAGLFEGSRRVEVLNAGVIGYSTEQNRRQLERDLLPLLPDVVVICPTAQNDTTLRRGPPDSVLLERAGSLPARLSQLRIAQRLGIDFTPGDFPAASEAITQGLLPGQPGVGPRVPPARFTENLRAMAQAAALADVPCVFVATPHEPVRTTALPELAASEERVLDAARRSKARLVDVREDFAAYAPLKMTSDDIHFTPLGQQLIAIAVARALLREPALLDGGERAPFLAAWAVATEDGVEAHREALSGGDLPPSYQRMAEAVLIPDLDDARVHHDPSIPPEFVDHDPFWGHRVERVGLGVRLIAQWRIESSTPEKAEAATRHAREHAEHVVPEDAFLLRAGGETVLKARMSDAHALPRLLTAFDTLIGAVPPSFDRRQAEGTRAFAEGDHEAAIRHFDDVLALAPRLPEVLYLRGLALRRAGRPEEARSDFLAAVEAAPSSALGLYLDGMLALQAGETERAEVSLRAAVRRDPGHAAARTTLARLLVDRGDLDEAETLLEGAAVLRADPAGVRALLMEIESLREDEDSPAGAAR